MTYVVGDIHGEYDKANALLSYIPSDEKLIFIGDYINKGPDSKKVIDLLLDLTEKRSCVFLMGNHEFKLLQAWRGNPQALDYLAQYGFQATLESYLEHKIAARHFNQLLTLRLFRGIMAQHYRFFKKLQWYYQNANYFVVHAGLPMNKQGRFKRSPSEKLVFLREEYLRTQKKYNRKIVIFGHTAFPSVFWDGYKLGIDTGAVYSRKNGYGRLSAVKLETFECLNDRGERSRPILVKNREIVLKRGNWREL